MAATEGGVNLRPELRKGAWKAWPLLRIRYGKPPFLVQTSTRRQWFAWDCSRRGRARLNPFAVFAN